MNSLTVGVRPPAHVAGLARPQANAAGARGAQRLVARRGGLFLSGLIAFLAAFDRAAVATSTLPRPVLPLSAEDLGRAPLNSYGSLQGPLRAMREYRPLDLNAENWRKAHPAASHGEWARQAWDCLRGGLHYDLPPVDLQAKTLERVETDAFIRERIEFNTTPWFRVPGYFYTPKNVPLPAPALIVFHEWGGPMLFGADRVCGEPVHPAIAAHRAKYTSGRPLADWFASQGYAVIVIDAYHFGARAPRGVFNLPASYDPAALDAPTLEKYGTIANSPGLLYLGIRELTWAGTTWAGVNFGDDSRCVDYLLSRQEVDGTRIGCTGLSGGGWRTNMLAALEPRIKAAVSVGWMTTGDAQQAYNSLGGTGTFTMLPGVWNRMDVPDLISMAAPKACMVVSTTEDRLFSPLGQREAARQIADAFAWAGHPERFRSYMPAKPHCYDQEVQAQALAWFDQHLKPAKRVGAAMLPQEIEPIQTPFEMPQPTRPVFPDRVVNIREHGAVDDGRTLCTAAIGRAIEACAKAGGGRVLVPAGTWLTGAVHLQSNIELHLEQDAVLRFSTDPKDYLPPVFTRWAGFECYNYSPLIYARDCENIAITGAGKLDGQGKPWWGWLERQKEMATILLDYGRRGVPVAERIFASPDRPLRPQFISPINCRNVLIEGISLNGGPFWTIQLVYCENVIVRGVTIQNAGPGAGPNNDGINLDSCRNALVEYCTLDTGDDCICLKSGCNEDGWRVGRPTENVVIRYCLTKRGHGGAVIGSEMSGGVRHVLVHDCVYDGTQFGVRLKSARGRGGVVEDIWVRGIAMKAIMGPAIYINSFYQLWAVTADGKAPVFRNIHFSDISCVGARVAVELTGLSDQPIESLTLERIKISARTGLRATDVRGLNLREVTIEAASGPPFQMTNCRDVVQ